MRLLLFLQDHSRFVNSVRYSPNGELFVSGGAEGKVSFSFDEMIGQTKSHDILITAVILLSWTKVSGLLRGPSDFLVIAHLCCCIDIHSPFFLHLSCWSCVSHLVLFKAALFQWSDKPEWSRALLKYIWKAEVKLLCWDNFLLNIRVSKYKMKNTQASLHQGCRSSNWPQNVSSPSNCFYRNCLYRNCTALSSFSELTWNNLNFTSD